MRHSYLNFVYRLVSRKKRKLYIPVAENISGRARQRLAIGAILFALCVGNGAPTALAQEPAPGELPTGGQITSGSGGIASSGSAMTVIQNSDRMVTNWNTFNIGRDASVTFNQPGASSVALNRITDQNPSQIFGNLSANGQVFLTNSAGIVFGPTAQVNVGGLVASALNMTNEDFQAGQNRFSGNSSGEIVNQGQLTTLDGGVVAMVGPIVRNEGKINTPSGSTLLVAGTDVTLDLDGDGLITYRVDGGSVSALAENIGTISAGGGMVVMTSRGVDDLISSVVNNEGIIEAKSLESRNGKIILDAQYGQSTISGTLDVASLSGKAGKIVVTGKQVFLEAGTSLNASGATGGGEIFVGGGWQGSDTSIHNATETVVKQEAVLDASAIDNGNGGNVVVWSDKATFFSGSIFARGGEYSGDGGNVEVSGKENLGFFGNVNILSPNGTDGSLLLDPNNITIVDGSAGQTGAYVDWSVNDSDYTNYVIPETVLEGLAGNVELTAYNNIIINNLTDNILNLSATSISFFSNDESSQSSMGGFTMDVSDTIRLNGAGNLTLQGGSQAGPSSLYSIYAGNLETNSGDVIFNTKRQGAALPMRVTGTITTNGGDVLVADGTRFALVNSDVVDVQFDSLISTSGGNFTSNMTGTVKVDGGMNLGAGTATFGGTGTQINSVITSTNAVTIDSPLTFGANSGITTTGTVTFNQTAAMANAGDDLILTADDFVFNNTFTGNNGNITLKPYNAGTDVDLGTTGDGDMTITDINFSKLSGFANIIVGRIDGTGTTKVVSNSSMSSGNLEIINQTVDITGGTLANTGGDIILSGDTFNITKGVTANGGTGTITVRQQAASDPINLGTGITTAIAGLMSANTLEIGRTNGGDVTFDGDISTTASNVNVFSGGDITFDTGKTLSVGTGIVNLVAGGNFINNSGASAISTSGDGRWLIWSSNPANNTRGGLAYDFKQYNATYGSTAVSGGAAEDGFLYTLAPTITASLTGSVDKTYDAATTATLAAGNYSQSGEVDGDTVNLNNPTSGTYDNKNVGTGKTVTATGVAVASASNGGKTVYGYQMASTTATDNVGTLTRKDLTVSGITASDKTYDGTTAATINTSTASLNGVVNGDTVILGTSGATGAFADSNAGTNKLVTVTDFALTGVDSSNYSLGNPTTTATIDPVPPPPLPPIPPTPPDPPGIPTPPDVLPPEPEPEPTPEPPAPAPEPESSLTVTEQPFSFVETDTTTTIDLGGTDITGTAEAREFSLPIFSSSKGVDLTPLATVRVTDTGRTISVKGGEGALQTIPQVGEITGRMATQELDLPSGSRQEVSVGMTEDGILVIIVPKDVNLSFDEKKIVSIGLAVAKQKLGVVIGTIKGVVIQER